ncbi:hypothetical protein AwWohl_14040 [Gammaproteobacteria bacterium]|nr:hypothetical protein AwWohl_14040 [Gammaproteobacteria bacterium]
MDAYHKSGGSEVWVIDLPSKQRIKTIKLKNISTSITYLPASSETNGLLAVTNKEMTVDIYDANTGVLIQTQSGFGQETPFLIHPVNQ